MVYVVNRNVPQNGDNHTESTRGPEGKADVEGDEDLLPLASTPRQTSSTSATATNVSLGDQSGSCAPATAQQMSDSAVMTTNHGDSWTPWYQNVPGGIKYDAYPLAYVFQPTMVSPGAPFPVSYAGYMSHGLPTIPLTQPIWKGPIQ